MGWLMKCAVPKFCENLSRIKRFEFDTHFNIDATPPLLIVSLCSVKTCTFVNGYSKLSSGLRGFVGRGVRKYILPAGI